MSKKVLLEAVLNFIKGGNLQPGSKPGFSHALKLSYNTIEKERLSLGTFKNDNNNQNNNEGEDNNTSNNMTTTTKKGKEDKILVYRYPFSKDDISTTPSVGLFMALMDELSSDTVFLVGMPGAPGVSLQMQTEIFNHTMVHSLSEIDIVSRVTKLGRIVTHTRTDFLCPKSGKLLAQGTHIKYMPTGSRFMDFVFNNRVVYSFFLRLTKVESKTVPTYPEKQLIKEVIKEHLEFQGISGRATFHVTREHTNPFGGLHGGCHAILMEQVALVFAKNILKSDMVVLESMQVEYLRAAKGTVEIVCEEIGRCDKESLHVRVSIEQAGGGGKSYSIGKLQFSAKAANSKL